MTINKLFKILRLARKQVATKARIVGEELIKHHNYPWKLCHLLIEIKAEILLLD